MDKIIGTPYYVAPEVLSGKYDEKCDIWSIGVIMYILLSGEPPFNGEDNNEILAKVKAGDYKFNHKWRNISKQAKELIKRMLTFDPLKRINAQESLKHEWFNWIENKATKKDSVSLKSTLQDLSNFRIEQKMQQAALTYMANHLIGEEELKKLNNVFKQLDVDNNGKLSKEELMAGYNKIKGNQLTKEELEQLFIQADADNSGEIDYSEWVLAAANKNKLLSKENLEVAFKMFDEDGSGKISSDELKSVLGGHHSKHGEKFWKDMIEEVDENGDGEIDFEEFKKMMSKLLKQKF